MVKKKIHLWQLAIIKKVRVNGEQLNAISYVGFYDELSVKEFREYFREKIDRLEEMILETAREKYKRGHLDISQISLEIKEKGYLAEFDEYIGEKEKCSCSRCESKRNKIWLTQI
jgi:hypothetical protein